MGPSLTPLLSLSECHQPVPLLEWQTTDGLKLGWSFCVRREVALSFCVREALVELARMLDLPFCVYSCNHSSGCQGCQAHCFLDWPCFLNKSSEENNYFVLSPKYEHFPLYMLPDITVWPWIQYGWAQSKIEQGKRGLRPGGSSRCLSDCWKRGRRETFKCLGQIFLWCLGLMKTWVARMSFIPFCMSVQRVRQFGLYSCCNRCILEGVIETWPVSKVKSSSVILTLIMVKVPSFSLL